MKKIVFMGTPIFAANILEHIISKGYNVSLVVSQPDKIVGRKKELQQTPVKQIALKYGIEVFQPTNIKEDYSLIQNIKPDLIITAAYGQIVPQEVLDIPTICPINIHGSLLPKYRGGAPIHHSVLNGDKETGITIMEMFYKMDSGDIIYQESIPIDIDDTTSIVHDNLINLSKEMLDKYLDSILDNDFTKTKQDETLVTYSPNISPEQERCTFNDTSLNVHNKIRGLSSFPGAYTFLEGTRIKIFKSKLTNIDSNNEPGTIASINKEQLLVNTKDKQISLLDIQISGKKRMPITQFLQGKNYEEYLSKRFD
ncbi:MAG: methionyl-tRNA formyltransferase [Mycoplasmatales bacterium]